jgi:hypothetical protein
MTIGQLQKPKNHDTLIGKPMLFAVMPTAKLKSGGEAKIQYNIGNGGYLVDGQKGSPIAYACKTLKDAIEMAKTVNHYNATGESKAFKGGKISELVLVD